MRRATGPQLSEEPARALLLLAQRLRECEAEILEAIFACVHNDAPDAVSPANAVSSLDTVSPPDAVSPRDTVSPAEAASQCARVLAAAVQVLAQRGFAGATVTQVAARAGVSKRTFYEQFGCLEECAVAVMDQTLEQVGALAAQAFEHERARSWRDGMLLALAAVLVYFDERPALARVCMVDTLGASPTVVAHRERVISTFRGLIVARIEQQVSHPSPLIAEATLASVMGIVHARLAVAPEPRQPLIALLGPLMGAIVEPVADRRTTSAEIRRGDALARAIQAGDPNVALPRAPDRPRVPGRR